MPRNELRNSPLIEASRHPFGPVPPSFGELRDYTAARDKWHLSGWGGAKLVTDKSGCGGGGASGGGGSGLMPPTGGRSRAVTVMPLSSSACRRGRSMSCAALSACLLASQLLFMAPTSSAAPTPGEQSF
ncbi:hypothetical protein AAG570_010125 [Ranatra chinensis]|uniref:Uncharacterized protein n=1 Tax=Ranatra chinensis TaxID=642074 RepID=A0ABD0YLM5_9HEMI